MEPQCTSIIDESQDPFEIDLADSFLFESPIPHSTEQVHKPIHDPPSYESLQPTKKFKPNKVLRVARNDGKPLIFESKPIANYVLEKTTINRYFYGLLSKVEKEKNVAPVQDEPPVHEWQQKQRLWTEHYAPKRFVDLVSPDSVNVPVLSWMNEWKQFVLGATKSIPEKKIMLISGSPGTGKTTLATIAGITSGFHVVEINASDDRSGDKVVTKINESVQVHRNLKNNKPNMILLDEIDGVMGGENNLIQFLCKLSSNEKKPLKRPIICICNDIYVPALRPLKNIALVITMTKPSIASLCSRLKDISHEQKMHVDQRALTRLCELTECDIRSCLHAMQFFYSKKMKMTFQDVEYVGIKDIQTSRMDLLKKILLAPDSRKVEIEDYFHNLVCLLERHQDSFGTMIEGCFENSAHLCKEQINVLVELGDWLHFDEHRPSSYAAMVLMWCRKAFAKQIHAKLLYPTEIRNMNQLASQNKNILQSFVRIGWNATNTRLQLLSSVIDLIDVSHCSTMNPLLLKTNDRFNMDRILKIMRFYDLNFQQSKADYSYSLDPPLHTLMLVSRASPRNVQSLHQYLSQQINTKKIVVAAPAKQVKAITNTKFTFKKEKNVMLKKSNPSKKCILFL